MMVNISNIFYKTLRKGKFSTSSVDIYFLPSFIDLKASKTCCALINPHVDIPKNDDPEGIFSRRCLNHRRCHSSLGASTGKTPLDYSFTRTSQKQECFEYRFIK